MKMETKCLKSIFYQSCYKHGLETNSCPETSSYSETNSCPDKSGDKLLPNHKYCLDASGAKLSGDKHHPDASLIKLARDKHCSDISREKLPSRHKHRPDTSGDRQRESENEKKKTDGKCTRIHHVQIYHQGLCGNCFPPSAPDPPLPCTFL